MENVARELAPKGSLRVAINLSNPLLVTSRTPSGDPEGLAPSLAVAFAAKLSVPIVFLCFDSPGALMASAGEDAWDVAIIGSDPARTQHVAFTAPFCEIEAAYLVPEASPLKTVQEVDVEGIRIAAFEGSAYDKWLSREIRHAEVWRANGHDATYDLFRAEGLDALAGLRTKLTEDLPHLPGCRLLPGKFMSVEQAACTKKDRTSGLAALHAFVEDAKVSGQIQEWMEQFGVAGHLTVPPSAA